MPRGELQKGNLTRPVYAITLENQTKEKQEEQLSGRKSMNMQELKDIDTMTAKMVESSKQRMNERVELLTVSAQSLVEESKRTFEKATEKLDDYEASSERNYAIVTKLDAYLKELDETGIGGSEAYMRARTAIDEYRKQVIDLDGNRTHEGAAIDLENSFEEMGSAVDAIIFSYEERGIVSTYRRGGKRADIFRRLKKELMQDTKRPEQSGALYRLNKANYVYEGIRENEWKNGEYSVNRSVAENFEETVEKIKSLKEEVLSMKEGIERDEKVKLLNEKNYEIQNSYKRYLLGKEALSTPPITKLQQKAMDERMKKWSAIREGCEEYVTLKKAGKSVSEVDYTNQNRDLFEENMFQTIREQLALYGQKGRGKYLGDVHNMLVKLEMLDAVHKAVRRDMSENFLSFKKGTSANLETAFQEAYEATKVAAKLGKSKTGTRINRIANTIKKSMEKGIVASGVGELILVSAIREGEMYESREEMEKPLTDEEKQQFLKPLSAEDANVDIRKLNAFDAICLLERHYMEKTDLGEIDEVYSTSVRMKNRDIEDEEERKQADIMPEEANRVVEEYNEQYRKIQDKVIELDDVMIQGDLLRCVEIGVLAKKMQRKLQAAFLREYKEELSKANRPLNKKEKNVLLYNMIMHTETGKAARRIDDLMASMGMLIGRGAIGVVMMINDSKQLSCVKKKIGCNVMDYNHNVEFEALIGETFSSPDVFIRKGGMTNKMAEKERIDAIIERAFAGKGFSEAEMAAFKGEK